MKSIRKISILTAAIFVIGGLLMACENNAVEMNETTQSLESSSIEETTDAQTEISSEESETTVPKTEEPRKVPTYAQIAKEDRIFLYKIWNFKITPMETVKKIVDTVVDDGFNSIAIHITWALAEPTPNVYDFEPYEEMLDYIINEKNLKAMIVVDFCRLSSTLGKDGVLSFDEVQYTRGGKLGEGGADTRVMPSFSSESAMSKVNAFFEETVEHFDSIYGDDILYYLVTNTPYCETEYWCTDEYDYSESARQGFYQYLKDEFGTIDTLNEALGSDYSDFDDIELPSLNSTGKPLGALWYKYRHITLKDFIDMCADTLRKVCGDSEVGLSAQLGSTFDGSIVARGVVNFPDLCENIDLVWVDDGPKYNHSFACDYTRSNLNENTILAQEIDGPTQVGASTENYLRQGLECFKHGCQVVGVANWSMDENYNTYKEVWNTISNEYLKADGEFIGEPEEEYLTVKLSELLALGNTVKLQSEYEQIAPEGDKYIGILIYDDLVNLTDRLIAGESLPQTVTLRSSFSTEQGYDNLRYGKLVAGEFVELEYSEADKRWQDDSFSIIAPTMMHPGANDDTALCYTVQNNGKLVVDFSATLQSPDSDGVTLKVIHNDSDIYDYLLESGTVMESIEISVSSGDEIYFVIGRNKANSYDSTTIDLTFTTADGQ